MLSDTGWRVDILQDNNLSFKTSSEVLIKAILHVSSGQIVIVALLFPLVVWATRSRHHRRVVVGASAVILLFGVGWLVERVLGLSYMPM